MNQHTKTIVEVPMETFNEIRETQERIVRALENLKVLTPSPADFPYCFRVYEEMQNQPWHL